MGGPTEKPQRSSAETTQTGSLLNNNKEF